jgi:hypothetical protein
MLRGALGLTAQGLALMLVLTPAMAAPEESDVVAPCTAGEHETVVCDNGKRLLRVIRDTASPSGRYAVAWAMVNDNDLRKLPPEPASSPPQIHRTVNCALCGDVLNFLVRLPDGKVLKRLDGRHFGDEARYNHYVNKVVWSPDEQYVVQVTDWRFGSNTAAAYHIGTNDRVLGPLRLTAPARRAAARALRRGPDKDYVLEKTAFIEVASIDNGGLMKFTAAMAAPKEQGFSFDMMMQFKPGARALVGDITSAEQKKD